MTAPYIATPPEGDGQEIDLLSGGVRTGTYAVRVIDAPTGIDGTGTIRVVTNELEDAEFRQQLLSRRAYVEVSDDGGATWQTLQAGYVTNIKLASAIAYEFQIGDTRRVETSRKVFTWSEDAGPTGISERDVFPGRGCLTGGPIIGGFGPVDDTGGDEANVLAVETDSVTGRDIVLLAVTAAYLPPAYNRTTNQGAMSTYFQKVFQPYALSYAQQVGITNPTLLGVLEGWDTYPGVSVILSDGTTEWRGTLRGWSSFPTYFAMLLPDGATPPTPGTGFRVRTLKGEVGEDSPIYIDQHPVDVVTNLFDTVGIEWDATTATTVKEALGTDLRYALRIVKPELLLDFLTKSIFGPFGFSIRNGDDGEQEFYTTRLLNAAAPTITIDTDDLSTDEPPIFALDEGSIVSAFKISYQTFARTTLDLNASPPPPPDSIVVDRIEVIVENADVSVFSTREIDYTLPGFVHLAGSWASAMGQLISAITILGFDRYGRGAPEMEVEILSVAPGYALRLGDEVYLDVAHYPNRGYRIGESTVGARIAQVVRRTVTPTGAQLKLIDSGLDLQPVSPAATIAIAANAGAPRTVPEFTITNAAAINTAAVLGVAVQWNISATTPTTDGQVFTRYLPGEVPTGAVQLPPVVPGSIVWVRARTEQNGRRPSAWTAWASVTLSAFNPPTGVTISGITAESFNVAWTPADATYWTEVFVAPGAVAPSDWSPYRLNLFAPGSDRTTIRGLAAATAYIVGVCHRDLGTGERTAFATDTDTTTTNVTTAPTPIALLVIPSEQNASDPVGIGLGMWAFDESLDIEIQRASDVSGSPGVFATIATVPGTTQVYRDLLPSDGLTRWYRIRHSLPGFIASPYTGAQSGIPGSCPVALNRPALAPTLNIVVTPGDPDYTIAWSGTGTITVSITGGAFGTPAASPITVTRIGTVITYLFRAVLNGVTVESLVTVPVSTATVPALTSVSRTEVQAIDCGVNWIVSADWITTDPNDTDYKIVVRDYYTTAIVADNQTTASGGYVDDTGEVGDPAFLIVLHERRYTIEIVRLADSVVVDTLDTTAITVLTGASC